MHYAVIGEIRTDSSGYFQSPVVSTLTEAAAYYGNAGDRVFVCGEDGRTPRRLTEAEEAESSAASDIVKPRMK